MPIPYPQLVSEQSATTKTNLPMREQIRKGTRYQLECVEALCNDIDALVYRVRELEHMLRHEQEKRKP